MTQTPSLFAQKLRAWRAQNGAHGRMTQEELADRLDVSLDAISKYERSLSFIRGDLEHRLAEQLNWSREQIVACRKDWQARQPIANGNAYSLLDDAVVAEKFNGSWRDAARASVSLADAELNRLPEELAADEEVFAPIYNAYRSHWTVVMHKGRMVAKWALPFLLPEDEALFRTGRMNESDLSVDRIHKPILPGTYFGYCPALIVSPGHEGASALLFSSFVRFLEDLARRDILLHGMGATSCSPGGAQICRDLGMTRLGDYHLGPDYGVWELPGGAIAKSIFVRRSPLLRRSYANAFPDG